MCSSLLYRSLLHCVCDLVSFFFFPFFFFFFHFNKALFLIVRLKKSFSIFFNSSL